MGSAITLLDRNRTEWDWTGQRTGLRQDRTTRPRPSPTLLLSRKVVSGNHIVFKLLGRLSIYLCHAADDGKGGVVHVCFLACLALFIHFCKVGQISKCVKIRGGWFRLWQKVETNPPIISLLFYFLFLFLSLYATLSSSIGKDFDFHHLYRSSRTLKLGTTIHPPTIRLGKRTSLGSDVFSHSLTVTGQQLITHPHMYPLQIAEPFVDRYRQIRLGIWSIYVVVVAAVAANNKASIPSYRIMNWVCMLIVSYLIPQSRHPNTNEGDSYHQLNGILNGILRLPFFGGARGGEDLTENLSLVVSCAR